MTSSCNTIFWSTYPHGCLLNRLFRRRSKKTSELRVTGLREENSPVTILWCHHGYMPSSMSNFKNASVNDDINTSMLSQCLTYVDANIIQRVCIIAEKFQRYLYIAVMIMTSYEKSRRLKINNQYLSSTIFAEWHQTLLRASLFHDRHHNTYFPIFSLGTSQTWRWILSVTEFQLSQS